MKTCPTCKSNYPDDTLMFCLEDGAQLHAGYDSAATLVVAQSRNTDPPETMVIPPEYLQNPPETVTQHSQPNRNTAPTMVAGSGPQHSPPPQPVPLQPAVELYNPSYTPPPAPPKPSRAPWFILGGVVILLLVGVAGAVGVMVWRSNSDTNANNANKPVAGTNNANNTNNSNNTNDRPIVPPDTTNTNTPGPVDTAWINGTWTGEGKEVDGSTWPVTLAAAEDSYDITFPTLDCTGTWALVSINGTQAKFTEVITSGGDNCASGGGVTVTKIGDTQISCLWTYEDGGGDNASAILTKQ